eukprot:11217461-Lingulodinium_polyedra.AAC.1
MRLQQKLCPPKTTAEQAIKIAVKGNATAKMKPWRGCSGPACEACANALCTEAVNTELGNATMENTAALR